MSTIPRTPQFESLTGPWRGRRDYASATRVVSNTECIDISTRLKHRLRCMKASEHRQEGYYVSNTQPLRYIVMPAMREWLSERFPPRTFSEKRLTLVTGASRLFSATSDDHSVVAVLETGGGVTATGKPASGAINAAEMQFWRLTAIPKHSAGQKFMIFADQNLLEAVKERLGDPGKLGVQFQLCKLSADVEKIRQETLKKASKEIKVNTLS